LGSVEGSAVKEPAPRAYERLRGAIPLAYAPGSEERAAEVSRLLEAGTDALREILGVEPPELEALLVAGEDWERAPRENERPYPPGLPYFTRSTRPPALVLPETLSAALRPRTGATYPLAVWHELAHAFLLVYPVPHGPAWLRELVPQALCAAVARRSGLPLGEHLAQVEEHPGLTVRRAAGRASAQRQMAFQNLLLALGAAALEEFGEGFLKTLAHALWEEKGLVDERRAEELLADALGPGGREWLASKPEF
jgi:hypothetical protein